MWMADGQCIDVYLPERRIRMNPQNRRSFLKFVAAGTALSAASAQTPRDWGGKVPTRYPEPDVVVLDKRFAKYKIGNNTIERLHTGLLWAEGPAWNGAGRFLVLSDIPND